MSLVSASEAFFDNLTMEQEFMTGVDTDKVINHILKVMLTWTCKKTMI